MHRKIRRNRSFIVRHCTHALAYYWCKNYEILRCSDFHTYPSSNKNTKNVDCIKYCILVENS